MTTGCKDCDTVQRETKDNTAQCPHHYRIYMDWIRDTAEQERTRLERTHELNSKTRVLYGTHRGG